MLLAVCQRDICKAGCPETYSQLIDRVDRFCRGREYESVVEDLFTEDWVANWAGFTEAYEFILGKDWFGNEDAHLADEG